MQALRELPLLSGLPRVELAKLVSDIVPMEVKAGQEVRPEDRDNSYVYFIHTGKMGIYLDMTATPVSLITIGSGEVIKRDPNDELRGVVYRAIEDTVLYCLDTERFEQILSHYPRLLRDFSDAMVKRSNLMLDELARTKSALVTHAAEVWSMIEEASEAMEEVSAATVALAEAPVRQEKAVGKPWVRLHTVSWRQVLGVVVPMLLALGVLLAGHASSARITLAVLVWGVSAWLDNTLPDYVVALTMALLGVMGHVIKPDAAFAGFANRNWFLLLAVLGISAGISRSGLLYRVALQMLRVFPATYVGQSTALATGGLVLAPFLPGITGRQTMASRLALELGEAMGFKQGSRGLAGMALACLLGFSSIYFISMTGASATLMMWTMLPPSLKASVTWSRWLLAALPISLVIFLGSLLAVLALYRPRTKGHISRKIVESQLQVLGPLGKQEKLTVWVLLAIVVAFVTQPIHQVDPTWVALPGFLLLCATGVVDKDLLRGGIDWGFLLLSGGLLGITTLTNDSEFVKLVTSVVSPMMRPFSGNIWIFLTMVALFTTVMHLLVPSQSTVLLGMLALVPAAQQFGYNPFIVGLVILVVASHFIIPNSNPAYIAAYGGGEGRAFTHKQAQSFSLVHALITLAAIWASIPIWHWMGLV